MTADVKTYEVEVDGSENGYIVICAANGHLKDLMETLKTCANCKVTEVNRDAIDDLKAMQRIYEQMS